MQPFIYVYHAVMYVFSLPSKILSYSYKGFLAFLSLFKLEKSTKSSDEEKQEAAEVKKLMEARKENVGGEVLAFVW